MSISAMRGLEMIVIGKEKHFEIFYRGGGYADAAGKPVDGLMDMICFNCSGAYYTVEEQPIEFCPACGQFERMGFENLREISQWANMQNWKFLKITGNSVFAVTRGEGWFLAFAKDKMMLEMKGIYMEINQLHSPE